MRAVYEVAARTRVDAPRTQVWDVYTDHVTWADWARIGKVRIARPGRPTINGVGCIRVISTMGISVHEEILSFDAPRVMTYRVIRGGLPIKKHLGEVRFEEDGPGATLVDWRCRFDSKIPGLGPLWKVIIAKVFRDTLAALAHQQFVDVGSKRASQG
jgi:hypothetical protein